MERDFNDADPKELPPPLGPNRERLDETSLLDRLRDLQDKDPAFVRWVLLRSRQVTKVLGSCGLDTSRVDVGQLVAAIAIDSYSCADARQEREILEKMVGLPVESD